MTIGPADHMIFTSPARLEPWRALVVRLAPNKPKRFSPSESKLSMG